MSERGASPEHAPGLFWRQSQDDPTQQLLVNGEGRCYVFAKSTSGKTFVVAYKNGAARFRDSMDYPSRYNWGQAVGVQNYSSGSTLNVQGISYTITFNRWAAGTEVTITPAPTDWGTEPGPTPPVSTTLFWRELSGDTALLVDASGRVVETYGVSNMLVATKRNDQFVWSLLSDFSQYVSDWGERQLPIDQPISIVEVDGVNYTFTSDLVEENYYVSISPDPGTYE